MKNILRFVFFFLIVYIIQGTIMDRTVKERHRAHYEAYCLHG